MYLFTYNFFENGLDEAPVWAYVKVDQPLVAYLKAKAKVFEQCQKDDKDLSCIQYWDYTPTYMDCPENDPLEEFFDKVIDHRHVLVNELPFDIGELKETYLSTTNERLVISNSMINGLCFHWEARIKHSPVDTYTDSVSILELEKAYEKYTRERD